MQLMEDWRTSSIPSSRPIISEAVTRSSRALQITSGNAQQYNLESFKAEGAKTESGDGQISLDLGPPQNYPLPPTLRSNAPRPVSAAQRLEQHRKHRSQVAVRDSRRPTLTRPFLTSKKYLEYRQRQRRDTGKDGEPVWPDELEDVFQDALIAIPPMGRKKMAQSGKSCGRNELISAYIKKWTGEDRCRKQVSSHLQVLNSILKDDPEWIALTRESEMNDRSHVNFYYDSIGDLVNSRKFAAQNQHAMSSSQGGVPSYAGGPLASPGSVPPPGSDGKSNNKLAVLSSLDFGMWVNEPNREPRIEEAYHVYTQLQGSLQMPTKLLEDVADWRLTHPYLRDLIDSPIEPLNCEIALLEASLQLMNDFPSRQSKLGIKLDLDFRRGNTNGHTLDLDRWTCNTIYYENGQVIHQVEDARPHTSPSTQRGQERSSVIVTPPCESLWWATFFTQLTEERRRSEDLGPQNLEVTEEQSRRRIGQLTAVQEIWATPDVWYNGGDTSSYGGRGGEGGRRRIAILLWKFRQTRPDEVGTTYWVKLVPPPANRMAANSPLPTVDLSLPPMTLDTVLASSHENLEHHARHDNHRMFPGYENGDWGDGSFAGHHGYDFFDPIVPGNGPESEHHSIHDMAFNDHLDIGDHSNCHPIEEHPNFHGGPTVVPQDHYDFSQGQHLHSYPSIEQYQHHDHHSHGSFHEHYDLHASNTTATMFNSHITHDTHHTDFHWDPATFEPSADHLPIDGSLGLTVPSSQLESRQRSVVEELFPEEVGAESHSGYGNDHVLQGESQYASESVEGRS